MRDKKPFLVFRDKWNEVKMILDENKDPYTVSEDEKGIWVRTDLSHKEMLAICELVAVRQLLAECPADEKRKLEIFPLSILRDHKLKKKYTKDAKSFMLPADELDEFVRLGI